MFRTGVPRASAGARIGCLVPGLEAAGVERALGTKGGENALTLSRSLIARVMMVRYFKGRVMSGSKCHVTIGHETVVATATFFGSGGPDKNLKQPLKTLPKTPFDPNSAYRLRGELGPEPESGENTYAPYVLLTLPHPVLHPAAPLVVGTRLDAPVEGGGCRVAFYGYGVEGGVEPRLFTPKSRTATVDRIIDARTVLLRNLISRDTDVAPFLGLRGSADNGDEGVIESTFGKSGKVKMAFPDGHSLKTGENITFRFRRYLHDKEKKMRQDED
eukprot:TRINITY_DN5924_c0_g1_i3.p1 TRINITY_DN5924_c0_g1~~TRINITY_DN5924_c0_g1_i3.p1  ORF type:complete len:273 (+),score=16.28 TRINITY_DN5924_c0_g1_i3:372-1190(+)